MTEDTSPENLRKFLESDDPALIRMGLSMAKGSGVPDDLLGEILWMYMFHDDKTIRAAAKSTFMKLAPEDAKHAVKENWKAKYRVHQYSNETEYGFYGLGTNLGKLGKSLSQTSVSLVGPLIRALSDDDTFGQTRKLSCVRLSDVCIASAEALGKMGVYYHNMRDRIVRGSAASALGEIGDARAVEPLVEALQANSKATWNGRPAYSSTLSSKIKKALVKLGHELRKPKRFKF